MKGLSDLHMKGLTEEWMCLCCLRPEEVAKVLPHSGQAWARAPTCWERMCLCKLLGSVNTCWVEKEKERERVYIHRSQTPGGDAGRSGNDVWTLPLSSFHIRSVCRCRVTSDGESSWTSSWKPLGTDRTCIPSRRSETASESRDWVTDRKI